MVALHDYWSNQRYEPLDQPLPLLEQSANGRLLTLRTSLKRLGYHILLSRQRYVISTAFLAFAGLLVSSLHKGRTSTYICSLVLGQNWRIPIVRSVNVLLDAVLLNGIATTYGEWIQLPDSRRKTVSRQWAYVLVEVAMFCTLLACITSMFGAQGGITFRIRGYYVQSLIGQLLLTVFFSWSALQLVRTYWELFPGMHLWWLT